MKRVLKDGGVCVWVVGDKTHEGTELLVPFEQALAFKSAGFRVHDTMIFEADRPPKTQRRYEQKFEFMFVFSKGSPTIFNPIMERCTLAGVSFGGAIRQHGQALEDRHTKGPIKDFKIKGNIWKYRVGCGSVESKKAHEHPAIYPLALAVDHIKSWTNEGAIVYDPFMGSGTTAVAAVKTRRGFIGSEISTDYTAIGNARVQRFQARVQGFFV